MTDLRSLATEGRNPLSESLDQLPTTELLQLINQQDQTVPAAVACCIPEIEAVVNAVAPLLKNNGRLFYVGAGTSGRLGCVDASEMPPTYGVSPDLIQGIIAGGQEALTSSIEGAEDDAEAGRAVIAARGVKPTDAVIGLSVSGRARYVREALNAAKQLGAYTACITNNRNAAIIATAQVAIVAETGPEVVTGSTRMKAGTSQKLILNMISTSLMIRLGNVKGNRMLDLQIKCEKLEERACNLIIDEAGVSRARAQKALREANGSVRKALSELEEE